MRGPGVSQRRDRGVLHRLPGANGCRGCFPPEHLLRETGVRTAYLGTRRGIPAERFYREHNYEINDEDIVMTHEW